MSSWYDAYVRTATENYVALKRKKRGPVRLIMPGWPGSVSSKWLTRIWLRDKAAIVGIG